MINYQMKSGLVMFLLFCCKEIIVVAFRSGHLPFFHIQVKELKNVYTTRVNVQVTTAQQNLDVAQGSLAEIRQKVIFISIKLKIKSM